MSELPTPTEGAPVELLRVWVEGETLQCALQADAFDDPGVWGEVLADVVRHLAGVLRQEGATVEQTVQRIRAGFDEEMRSPSTE